LLARRTLLAGVAGVALISSCSRRTGIPDAALISDGSGGAGIALVALVALVALCARWSGRTGDYGGSRDITSAQSKRQNQRRWN